MSHLVTINVKIQSLDALEAACQRLGLELVRLPEKAGTLNPHTFRWFRTGQDGGQCAHVLRMKGASRMAYEVGVVRQPDGSYTLAFDPFDDKLAEAIGQNGARLRQEYAVAAAAREARRRGWRVVETRLPNGTVKLVMEQ